MTNITSAGTDLWLGSWTFACMAKAPSMSTTITVAAGRTTLGTQSPTKSKIADPTLSVPTRRKNQVGRW